MLPGTPVGFGNFAGSSIVRGLGFYGPWLQVRILLIKTQNPSVFLAVWRCAHQGCAFGVSSRSDFVCCGVEPDVNSDFPMLVLSAVKAAIAFCQAAFGAERLCRLDGGHACRWLSIAGATFSA